MGLFLGFRASSIYDDAKALCGSDLICEDEADCADALKRFFHEMGAEAVTQPKLSVTATSLPAETTTVLLEARGKPA